MGQSPFSHNNRSERAETSKTNHSAPLLCLVASCISAGQRAASSTTRKFLKNLSILKALSQESPNQSNCRWKLSLSWPACCTRKPKSILCKCGSDAVQEAALDLHSSSTIPSPIERRRSQEAGSKGTGLINHHRTRIKQCTVGRRGKKQSRVVLVER